MLWTKKDQKVFVAKKPTLGYANYIMQPTFIAPQEHLSSLIKEVALRLFQSVVLPSYEVEQKSGGEFGDYATNVAFSIAKKLKQSPADVAQQIATRLFEDSPDDFEHVEVAGNGFVNMIMSKKFWTSTLETLSKVPTNPYQAKEPKTVIVEFSSPNVARPMHMGHIRNTVLGDFLARLYTLFGHKVIRWNHLGDWGTQFGKLIVAYREGWTNKEAVEKNPIEELVRIYVRFHDEIKKHPELESRAQEEFKKLEEKDPENTKLLNWFRAESLKEFNRTYNDLGVSFDVERGESAYLDDLHPLIQKLLKDNIAEESQGALIVPLEKEGLSPAMIQKSDGATLYMTREIASLAYRQEQYHPDIILYVVGNEQSLHFEQFFAIARILGYHTTMQHVRYGLVLSSETKRKLSTRGGVVVTGKHMLEEITKKALITVAEKQPDIPRPQQEQIAHHVAVSALRYSMLKDNRTSDVVFDPQQALSLHGNSAPYLQYGYTRILKILEKTQDTPKETPQIEEDFVPLLRHLSAFGSTLHRSIQDNSSHHLTQYLFELSSLCNSLYEKHSVIHEEDSSKKSTLISLFTVAANRFQIGFDLLGISVLQTM